jgi:hypothetical protein
LEPFSVFSEAPPPPAVAVIALNTELLPFVPLIFPVPPAPPAPIVTVIADPLATE